MVSHWSHEPEIAGSTPASDSYRIIEFFYLLIII